LIDVLVIGGGNAALCAALAAVDLGARVTVLERASMEERGGNSKYTRNIRVAHGPEAEMSGTYTPDELLEDLIGVTGADLDMELANLAVNESSSVVDWMEAHGARWQPAFKGTLQLERTNRFFLGGGKALLNKYYAAALRRGVEIRYGSCVEAIDAPASGPVKVTVSNGAGPVTVTAKAAVVASGGFEANREWLSRYWGDAVENFIIRGSRFNDGKVLANLLDHGGALERGAADSFHAVACDARAPSHDGGITTRVDAIPFGIVVNREGDRFDDEGGDVWPKRYATWGRLVAAQPGQSAFAIFDRSAMSRFIPTLYPPITGSTLEELAEKLGVNPSRFAATVETYNRSVPRNGECDFSRLDGIATQGLQIPKSNWAAPIVGPPFFAYPLRPGVTFTYLGLAVDRSSRVLKADGSRFQTLFAAGEVMAGNILRKGYLAGFGMTIGTVFGRLAGKEAALHAKAA
jgi:tricarballylate dehydrogenase